MLSRIAESLFWIGRYIERTEATARFLEVHLRMLLEDPWKTEAEACRDLLSLMGVEASEPDRDTLMQLLAYDYASPASVVSSWGAARDNARRAREVIPSEVWEVINTTWHQLPARAAGDRSRRGNRLPTASQQQIMTNTGSVRRPTSGPQPVNFLTWSRERSALFTGTARSTMVRDEGWQFLTLGRHLEQADMTSRLVSAATLVGTNPWPAVLRGCGAHDAFLRTYRGLQADREAAEFLITDERLPRSVMYGVAGAIGCLETIERDQLATKDSLHRLGKLRAQLMFTPANELLDNLNQHMSEVQRECDAVTSIVSASFFSATDPTAWTTDGVPR